MSNWRDDYRKDVREVTGEVPWTLMRVVTHVVLPVLVLLGIGGFAAYWGGLLSTPAKVIERTLDPDNMIYNYEWFFNKYHDIEAYQGQITEAEGALQRFEDSAGERSNWGFEDKQEWNRLNAVLLGLQNQRRSAIEDYNAKSEMVNRAIFKDGDLPVRIDQ